MIKKVVQKTLSILGYELRKKNQTKRDSLDGVLSQLQQLDLGITSVIDGGAALGVISKKIHNYFPDAKYVLVEPLEEYYSVMQKNVVGIGDKNLVKKAISDKIGTASFNVHPDLYGSSLYKEVEGEKVDGVERSIEVTTIDEIVKSNELNAPCFIKLDLQGAEIDALKGGEELLSSSTENVVVLEVCLYDAMVGSDNTFNKVIEYMESQNYVLYDLFGFNYRPYDNALMQIDCIFCHKDSPLRKFHGYATEEQRAEQFMNVKTKHNKLGINY